MLVNIRPHTKALHHAIRNKSTQSKNEIESLNIQQEQKEQDPTDRYNVSISLICLDETSYTGTPTDVNIVANANTMKLLSNKR